MIRGIVFFVVCFTNFSVKAAELNLNSPVEFQVVQRATKERGVVTISGNLVGTALKPKTIEARLIVNETSEKWKTLECAIEGSKFESKLEAPSGGWHRLEIRVKSADQVIAEAKVEHFGVGEIFVVAGQSNSANHSEERLASKTGKVAAFDGMRWQLSNDPQPGASGSGGSFIPPFGDSIARQFDVPVGIVAGGIGATSVRDWLPGGIRFPNPPTLVGRVKQIRDGEWESNGEAFASLIGRMKTLGPHGFRAVLWHQGESDANQPDASRTLTRGQYREYLENLIQETRREIGFEIPWFVAQATYHVPGDESSPEIRAAQASLWVDGVALEGPDTDAIKGDLRDSHGLGVHFSGPGQREHAARWVEKVAPWLEVQLAQSDSAMPKIGRLTAAKILFLGNSITRHGPKPDIGWTGDWGMAATSQELDYVHLLAAEIAKFTATKPIISVTNIAEFERNHETYDIPSKLQEELAFQADIVIVAIGENVAELATEQAKTKYATAFLQLLKSLKNQKQNAIFVRGCFWPNAIKDEIMRTASADVGATFIDIGKLGQIESNFARSERQIEHAGVAAHPGDKGMRSIADAILTSIQKRANVAILP